jgi:hypothetical protein
VTTTNIKVLKKSTLEDVDTALLDFFDKTLDIHVEDNGGNNKKVSVAFSGKERWAMMKANKTKVRDSTNTLVLPVIALRRLDFEKIQDSWALGRYFKTIGYTKVINGYETANRANALDARRRNNFVPTSSLAEKAPVYEIIEIPYPTFIKVNYSVNIWTQFIIDMNSILEKIWAKTNDSAAGSNQIQIESRTGNKYIVFLDQNATNESNVEDYSDAERTIKSTLQFKVLGYLLEENDVSVKKTTPCVSSIIMKEKTITDKDEISKIFRK